MRTRSESIHSSARSWTLAVALGVALAGVRPSTCGASAPLPLQIERSVLLSWPYPGTNDHIVVSAPSLSGPYVPCLEPSFRRLDRQAVAVPMLDGEQFYQLKPGGLLIESCDSYSDQWTVLNPFGTGAFEVVAAQGSLRISAAKGAADKWILWPPVPPPFIHGDMDYTDFATSVDILGWDRMTSASFGHIARAYYGDADQLYLGLITFENNAITELSLLAHLALPTTVVRSVPVRTSSKPHRLVFTGSGSVLALRLYALDRLTEPVASIVVTHTGIARGFPGGLWLNANLTGSSSFDITVDNLIIAGTRPE